VVTRLKVERASPAGPSRRNTHENLIPQDHPEPSQDIPFTKLILSRANVRRIKAGISVEDLAKDIARRGLLQALSVRAVQRFDLGGTDGEIRIEKIGKPDAVRFGREPQQAVVGVER
jgi:hypothetical protein